MTYVTVYRPSFFFSSSRWHTRSKRDWSSDVCSSDLSRVFASRTDRKGFCAIGSVKSNVGHLDRSEERRVGKECRSRWSPYHYKKKQQLGEQHLNDCGSLMLRERDSVGVTHD